MPVRIIDLSMPISERTPVFPGYPPPIVHPWALREREGYFANILMMIEHAGTHVDAPVHFIEKGRPIDQVDLNKFMGPGVVLDFSDLKPKSTITRELLEARISGIEVEERYVVLLYTGYSSKAGTPEWFEHPGLGSDAAKLLVEKGIKAVGIDAPSIDHAPFEAHRVLLGAGVPIYENLTNLEKLIGVKRFKFIGLPLKIVGGSASPVRAIAVVEE